LWVKGAVEKAAAWNSPNNAFCTGTAGKCGVHSLVLRTFMLTDIDLHEADLQVIYRYILTISV
jgi:hypothetical protein